MRVTRRQLREMISINMISESSKLRELIFNSEDDDTMQSALALADAMGVDPIDIIGVPGGDIDKKIGELWTEIESLDRKMESRESYAEHWGGWPPGSWEEYTGLKKKKEESLRLVRRLEKLADHVHDAHGFY